MDMHDNDEGAKYVAAFEVDEKMQDASARQFFCKVLVRPKIPLLALLIVMALFVFLVSSNGVDWQSAVMATVLIFVSVGWVKAYIQLVKYGRQTLKIGGNSRIEISCYDNYINYVSPSTTKKYSWDNVGRLVSTNDFIILMNGAVPIVSIPKACASSEMIAFIEERLSTKKTSSA